MGGYSGCQCFQRAGGSHAQEQRAFLYTRGIRSLSSITMRAVVQRVSSAAVSVDKETISSIGQGLLVLVGIAADDKQEDVEQLAKKILKIRMWPDAKTDAAWKSSVKDINGEILCVSQFTLTANTSKGSKPDFHRAMAPELSRVMYGSVLERLGVLYSPAKIQDGKFGAMMSVSLTNDGPVTFTLDTQKDTSTHISVPSKKDSDVWMIQTWGTDFLPSPVSPAVATDTTPATPTPSTLPVTPVLDASFKEAAPVLAPVDEDVVPVVAVTTPVDDPRNDGQDVWVLKDMREAVAELS